MNYCEADRIESQKRMKELEELKKQGKKTELQLWWQNTANDAEITRERWIDEDIAFVVQRRPLIRWSTIADALGKSEIACRKKYKRIERDGLIDFYMNYKLESLDIGKIKI